MNIGTNDVSTVNMAVVDNYNKIINRLREVLPPQSIICCAVRPVNYLMPLAKQFYPNNIAIRNVNGAINNICNIKGCVYEPQTYSVHAAPWVPDEIMIPTHTVDGIHLSPLGYQVEYEVIKKYLT